MASPGGRPPMKAPYPPTTWALGGAPVKKVDIPAQVVIMIFFMIGAAVHMKIFQKNRARKHKFLPNLFIFVFCVSRILTSILRIASVSNPLNVRLAIAAQIFVAAGVVILFIINLIFTTRLVRSLHPSVGWHPVFSIAFKIMYALTMVTIIIVISATVHSFNTLDVGAKATDRSLQLYGVTFLAIIATLPIPIVLSSLFIPYSPPDQFGIGRLRTKAIVLLLSAVFLSLGAWYRCGSSFQPLVPRSQPLPGYLGKAPFYFFNFVVEIQTVLSYAILRVDLRYHIPDGAKGPGSYSAPQQNNEVELTNSRPNSLSKHNANSETISVVESLPESVEIDNEKTDSIYLIPGQTPRSNRQSTASQSTNRLTHIFSKAQSAASRPISQRHNSWRDSEQLRIIKRLGGPWEELPSPTNSTFSGMTGAPSIPDTINRGDWTPSIQWDMRSPLARFPSVKRFASVKNKDTGKQSSGLRDGSGS